MAYKWQSAQINITTFNHGSNAVVNVYVIEAIPF